MVHADYENIFTASGYFRCYQKSRENFYDGQTYKWSYHADVQGLDDDKNLQKPEEFLKCQEMSEKHFMNNDTCPIGVELPLNNGSEKKRLFHWIDDADDMKYGEIRILKGMLRNRIANIDRSPIDLNTFSNEGWTILVKFSNIGCPECHSELTTVSYGHSSYDGKYFSFTSIPTALKSKKNFGTGSDTSYATFSLYFYPIDPISTIPRFTVQKIWIFQGIHKNLDCFYENKESQIDTNTGRELFSESVRDNSIRGQSILTNNILIPSSVCNYSPFPLVPQSSKILTGLENLENFELSFDFEISSLDDFHVDDQFLTILQLGDHTQKDSFPYLRILINPVTLFFAIDIRDCSNKILASDQIEISKIMANLQSSWSVNQKFNFLVRIKRRDPNNLQNGIVSVFINSMRVSKSEFENSCTSTLIDQKNDSSFVRSQKRQILFYGHPTGNSDDDQGSNINFPCVSVPEKPNWKKCSANFLKIMNLYYGEPRCEHYKDLNRNVGKWVLMEESGFYRCLCPGHDQGVTVQTNRTSFGFKTFFCQ